MTEEEKKAIETIKGLQIYYDDYCLLNEEEIEENENVNNSIDLIVNLVKKQQEEIEHLKWKNEIYVKSIKSHKRELEKKDKIIDKMAKTINEAYFASGDFEDFFENEICKVQRYEDYTYLEKNIKQYFQTKVEGSK